MEQQPARPSFWKTPFGIVATAAAVLSSAYLWLAHRDHVLALLPYAFLAACPLMHLFMHRGHGHAGQQGHGRHARAGRPDGDDGRSR